MRPKPTPTRPGTWRLVAIDGGARLDLPEGRHVLGAGLDATHLVRLPWGSRGVRLHVAAGRVRIARRDASIDVTLDDEPIERERVLRADGRRHRLSIGDSRLLLCAPPQDTSRATGAPAWPGRGLGLPGAAVAVVSAAVVVLAWTGASATRLPAPPKGDAEAPLRSQPASAGPSDVPGVRFDLDERGVRVATGVIRTREACQRMDRVRHAIGVARFVDRTVCLPAVRDHAQEWLAGTGLSVDAVNDRLVVRGAPSDVVQGESARRALETLRAALPASILDGGGIDLVQAPAPAPSAAASPDAVRSAEEKALLERARSLVDARRGVMTSQRGGATLLLEDGRAVAVGADVVPGVRLVGVDERAIVVETGGRRVSLALSWSAL